MKRNQSGFTLVEIAIVLVIIGLLLGGVLKGQELIDSSRAKSIYNDLRGVQTATNAYSDRYRALPGDDNHNTTNTYGWPANYGGGNANSLVGAAATNPFANPNGENFNFWRALGQAGFLNVNPTAAANAIVPRHALGGLIGVTNGVYALNGNVICAQGIPGKIASMIDRQYDDGINSTGNIRANVAAVGAASPVPAAAVPAQTAYSDGTTGTAVQGMWSVCMQM